MAALWRAVAPRLLLAAIASLGAPAWSGCAGTDVGNPEEARAALEFVAFEEATPASLTLASGVVVQEAWLVLDEISLRTTANCNASDDTIVEDTVVVELIAGVEYPESALETAPDNFCRLGFKLGIAGAEALPPGSPASLAGASLVVTGALADGTPFELVGTAEDAFAIRAPSQGFDLVDGPQRLLVAFALNEWFDAALIQEVASAAQGTPRLDDDANPATLNGLRSRLKKSVRLYRDLNDDGMLQPEEREPLLGAGE